MSISLIVTKVSSGNESNSSFAFIFAVSWIAFMIASNNSHLIESWWDVSCKFNIEVWASFESSVIICNSSDRSGWDYINFDIEIINRILSSNIKSLSHSNISNWTAVHSPQWSVISRLISAWAFSNFCIKGIYNIDQRWWRRSIFHNFSSMT